MNKKLLLLTLIAFLGLFITIKMVYKNTNLLANSSISKVFAEDDDEEEDESEDEDEEDDEDEDDDEERNNNSQEEYTYETVTVPAEKPIVKYVPVVALEYRTDTDGDGLVDAIDPNPTISEYKLFTDDDLDSVANAWDKYPGEDDFSYIDYLDANNNGITDDLENIILK